MRFRIIVILLISVFLNLSISAQTLGIVKANKANLRMLPSTTSPVLHKIPKDHAVQLLKTKEFYGWYFVEYRKAKGWMHKSTLKLFDKWEYLTERYLKQPEQKTQLKKWKLLQINETSYGMPIARVINQVDVVRNGSKSRIWVKYVPAPTSEKMLKRYLGDRGFPASYKRFEYHLVLFELKCDLHEIAILELTEYWTDLSPPIRDITPKNKIKFGPIPPESIGQAYLEVACK